MRVFGRSKTIGRYMSVNEGGRGVTLWIAPGCSFMQFRIYVCGFVLLYGDRRWTLERRV